MTSGHRNATRRGDELSVFVAVEFAVEDYHYNKTFSTIIFLSPNNNKMDLPKILVIVRVRGNSSKFHYKSPPSPVLNIHYALFSLVFPNKSNEAINWILYGSKL